MLVSSINKGSENYYESTGLKLAYIDLQLL